MSRFGKRNDDNDKLKKKQQKSFANKLFSLIFFFQVFFAFFFSGSRWERERKSEKTGVAADVCLDIEFSGLSVDNLWSLKLRLSDS